MILRIDEAVVESKKRVEEQKDRSNAAVLYSKLTKREIEIFNLVTSGFSSKQISGELFIATGTVENHRANIKKKLQAQSLSDLIAIRNLLRT